MSSNPAIGEDEDYPTSGWTDDHVHDYFTNRFGGGIKEWTRNANRGRRLDGTYGRSTPFWSAVRARARELYGREATPGRDFAITEVVHCKSLKEIGVRAAENECAGRYLLPVLTAAGATVIVGLGAVAAHHLRTLAPFAGNLSAPVVVAGRERLIAILPHPHRTFAKCMKSDSLDLPALLTARSSGRFTFRKCYATGDRSAAEPAGRKPNFSRSSSADFVGW